MRRTVTHANCSQVPTGGGCEAVVFGVIRTAPVSPASDAELLAFTEHGGATDAELNFTAQHRYATGAQPLQSG